MAAEDPAIAAAKIAAEATVNAARIAAEATVSAARIAADASTHTTVISIVGTLGAVAAAGITAYVTYFNARRQFTAEKEKDRAKLAALKADMGVTVANTVRLVDKTLDIYSSDFQTPIELHVLKLPTSIDKLKPSDKAIFSDDLIKAITNVGLTLDNYRKAKDPFQTQYGVKGDPKPALLRERPSNFDTVITAARSYRDALKTLEALLANSNGP
jgi:hypothetical protein